MTACEHNPDKNQLLDSSIIIAPVLQRHALIGTLFRLIGNSNYRNVFISSTDLHPLSIDSLSVFWYSTAEYTSYMIILTDKRETT